MFCHVPFLLYMCTLLIWFILASLISVGAYGCILDLLSVICYLVIDAVCNTRPSQLLGANYSNLLRTPLICLIIWEVSPLYDYEDIWLLMLWYDSVLGSGLITVLYHTLYTFDSFIPYDIIPNAPYITSVSLSLFCLYISVHWAF